MFTEPLKSGALVTTLMFQQPINAVMHVIRPQHLIGSTESIVVNDIHVKRRWRAGFHPQAFSLTYLKLISNFSCATKVWTAVCPPLVRAAVDRNICSELLVIGQQLVSSQHHVFSQDFHCDAQRRHWCVAFKALSQQWGLK